MKLNYPYLNEEQIKNIKQKLIPKFNEEDINNLTNYQYEVLGTISEPKLKRVKQEIQ